MRRTFAAFAVSAVLAAGAWACSKDPGKSGAASAPPAAAKAGSDKAAPKEAAPEAKAADAKPRVEGQGFVVEVKAPENAAAGAAGSAEVVLTATGGYHLNKEFPTVLEVTPPEGVDCPKLKLKVADAASFEEKTATWKVSCTAKDAGDKKFSAKFRFAVCTATTCDPKQEMLGWTLAVK